MADTHKKSFWGNKTALILESSGKTVPYVFLTCIKKTESGWEKPSKQEGKIIKLSLKEIICILEVLKKRMQNWRGYHIYKQESTEIHLYWKDKAKSICVFEIGSYKKEFKFPDTKLFTLLLNHILFEKIEFATSGSATLKPINDEK